MKKITIFIFAAFVSLLFIKNVNASWQMKFDCDDAQYINDGNFERTCYILLNNEHPTVLTEITGELIMQDAFGDIKRVIMDDAWNNLSDGRKVKLTAKTTGKAGEYKVAQFVFDFNPKSPNCDGKFKADEPKIDKHYCEIIDGYYYGKNGDLVSKEEYDIECGPKPPVCEYKDGKYYGPDGQVVTEEEYYKLCDIKPPTCEFKNGKYYGPDGQIVTEEEYHKLCDPKPPVCEYKNGKYYGPDGQIVTEEEYYKLCDIKPPVCEYKNGKYYGPDGQVVTKEEYDVLCPTVNPVTGGNNPYVFIFIGSILIGGICYYINKNKGLFIRL